MVSAPMLEVYNRSADTSVEVHINTIAKALGAVLLQKSAAPKHFHPIAYYSKNINSA